MILYSLFHILLHSKRLKLLIKESWYFKNVEKIKYCFNYWLVQTSGNFGDLNLQTPEIQNFKTGVTTDFISQILIPSVTIAILLMLKSRSESVKYHLESLYDPAFNLMARTEA